ncbi:hypothetical protein PGTUg99_016108 [Puccinia graminis f. sp. tritici]|uniref:Uncharacterized protein n=2 Tax=Puccinia graminis f. sp. tritici TaxID=56615 RepID=H6QTG5_PUCGT|nr:uncharacterized protein PGTG_22090 [Puccinia graminis f. sp. tritici CRL 75-36-700-3]EHS64180.1 hypothetical protein PGTG_22090 [Puccinia graminis f. sp. tritici CRL 75-36-700-3]KAA1064333.1 hypothetical protein PGTUg99_016108 [Puccinia graminis f. sp. tritici]
MVKSLIQHRTGKYGPLRRPHNATFGRAWKRSSASRNPDWWQRINVAVGGGLVHRDVARRLPGEGVLPFSSVPRKPAFGQVAGVIVGRAYTCDGR